MSFLWEMTVRHSVSMSEILNQCSILTCLDLDPLTESSNTQL